MVSLSLLFKKKGTICYLCKKEGADTRDHVIPLSKGGKNNLSNIEPAHKECNRIKGNKLPSELEGIVFNTISKTFYIRKDIPFLPEDYWEFIYHDEFKRTSK